MFTPIETWTSGLITDLTSSATTIILACLALTAFVVGAFYLIGLGKKAVKTSK